MVPARALHKIKTPSAKERSSTELRFTSFKLDDELTWELSRVKINVPSGPPLTAPKSPAEVRPPEKQVKNGRHVGLDFLFKQSFICNRRGSSRAPGGNRQQ